MGIRCYDFVTNHKVPTRAAMPSLANRRLALSPHIARLDEDVPSLPIIIIHAHLDVLFGHWSDPS